MPKVIYLTGAPAAGKSSTTGMLAGRVAGLQVWEYGARLTDHIKSKVKEIGGQDELRAKSGGIVTPKDVVEVDEALLAFVQKHRRTNHVIIDSHAVTKEVYGFRITPFSFQQFQVLSPDEIWVLYASPEETIRRIAADPRGRPTVTEEQARTHTLLQASVAAAYGTSIRCPVYMFDTAVPREDLVDRLVCRLS